MSSMADTVIEGWILDFVAAAVQTFMYHAADSDGEIQRTFAIASASLFVFNVNRSHSTTLKTLRISTSPQI